MALFQIEDPSGGWLSLDTSMISSIVEEKNMESTIYLKDSVKGHGKTPIKSFIVNGTVASIITDVQTHKPISVKSKATTKALK